MCSIVANSPGVLSNGKEMCVKSATLAKAAVSIGISMYIYKLLNKHKSCCVVIGVCQGGIVIQLIHFGI